LTFDKAVIARDTKDPMWYLNGPSSTGVFDGNAHTISNVTITGSDYLRLFGYLGTDAEIKNLGVVDVDITRSDDYVGGLVGNNEGGNLINSYSTGAVIGNKDSGGLVRGGYPAGVTGGFWDIQTSGENTSDGGTGLTTTEMQSVSTFLEAGWDFIGETANGTEDIWAVCEGVDYPHLAWEFVIGDFDADADIDFADFCIFAEHWLAADGSFWCGQGCDLTNDGSVNWQDLMVFAENWLR
jgi:hypothetical protein